MLIAIQCALNLLSIVTLSFSAYANTSFGQNSLLFTESLSTVKGDYEEFYSKDRLLRLGMSFGAGAILANTHADESFQKWYQTDIRSIKTNYIAYISKNFGEWKYLLPATLGTAIADNFNKQYFSTISRWGSRSVRAYILGTPLLWSTQYITGASRPGEDNGSSWAPFNDTNGVSGHAFVGAVPFLTLARMYDDKKYLKYFFYAASTLTAFSRINDDAHFFSQTALGWYIAWETTDTVFDRDTNKKYFGLL